MCIWWELKVGQRQLEIRAACHLWKKHSWWDPISKLEERNQREAFLILWSNGFQKVYYTPRIEVRGVYWNHHVRPSVPSVRPSVRPSVCPSVRPSVCPAAIGFPAHDCFPFAPIMMKLHMQTPHESRMCPIDFEVKRSNPRKIQIMQTLSLNNWVIRTLILLSATVFWHKKSWKFGYHFLNVLYTD